MKNSKIIVAILLVTLVLASCAPGPNSLADVKVYRNDSVAGVWVYDKNT